MRRPDSVTIQWILSGLQLRASRKQRLLHGCMDGWMMMGSLSRAAPPAQARRRQGRCRADISIRIRHHLTG